MCLCVLLLYLSSPFLLPCMHCQLLIACLQADLKRQEQVAAGRPAGRPDRHSRAPADEPGAVAAAIPHIPAIAGAPVRPATVQVWKGRRNAPLDVSQLPGVAALSAREREACSTLRFVPGHWTLLKETLLREDARAGGALSRTAARNLFRLEQGRALKVWDVANDMHLIGEDALSRSKAAAAAAAAAPAGAEAGSGQGDEGDDGAGGEKAAELPAGAETAAA